MGKGTLTIYSASAGSGKTFQLTGIYLTSLFKSRYNYRKILAVTFTNKSTAEMKSRILDNLHKLMIGEKSEYLSDLMRSTEQTEEWIRNESGKILNSILHDFSRFSILTIDSFFQKILRSFAREVGLHSGFNIELDHDKVLSSAIDEMVGSAVTGTQLNNWLTTYAMSNIDEDKSWNLKEGIISLSEELFKEKFKIFSSLNRSELENKEFLLGYIDKLKSVSYSFEKNLLEAGRRAEEIFSRFGLSDDMFYRKGHGVPGFIRSLASGLVKEPNSYVREIEKEPPRWSTGSIAPDLQTAIIDGLDKTLNEAIQYFDSKIAEYRTANSVLSNIYALGILSDVLYNVHIITASENIFLLSDAGELLTLITREDQSPFIYEKVGNRYENFMIDEFQDTSIIQWNNLRPLIENSMAEGFDNLVVGDIKQSIYRWRNSDWKIMGFFLNNLEDDERFISKPLTINWRSRSNIIRFNNSLFSIIPEQVDEVFANDSHQISFKKIYSDAFQHDPGENTGGYVRIEFIRDNKELKWKDAVLEKLPGIIETLQDKGYSASDIGIIVRDGKEGSSVLKTLIDYNNNCSDEKKHSYNFNVVSNDSLLLSNSPVICFIIAVISIVNDPEDKISRALMLRFFLLVKRDPLAESVSLISDKLIETSRNYFPEGYEAFLERIKQLPLFEATENIIKFFALGELSWNVAYLNTFQDHVVSFTGRKSADIQSFLDWWEITGKRKSVVLPGNQNAMRILTIHKSKGLEFKVVILPFLSWNLDHLPSNQPFLWVNPATPPFNDVRVVPVKYSSELSKTFFAEAYEEEKHSVYIDNINLLYVALTRARDIIYGFSIDNPKSSNTIAGILKNAITLNIDSSESDDFNINWFYNSETNVFEYGEIPGNNITLKDFNLISAKYSVSQVTESLKLRLHGENYFSAGNTEIRKRINYGKLMHEVFEGINTQADIQFAVKKLVLEGKLPEEESADIEKRINSLIMTPGVSEWFASGNEVRNEAGILMPSGSIRRPDRVIFKDGKTIIIDFKFGERNPHYSEQVDQYRKLLIDMGYSNIEAFIWYVDNNSIESV